MNTRIFILLLTLFTTGLGSSLHADAAADIRQRMEQRLPALDRLKAAEVVGENNRGFVETRKSDASAASVVADENRDREAVYALIAKNTGVSPDAVGRARAKQIAANSRGGVWIQGESGNWARK